MDEAFEDRSRDGNGKQLMLGPIASARLVALGESIASFKQNEVIENWQSAINFLRRG
jgi:hypothetical protein